MLNPLVKAGFAGNALRLLGAGFRAAPRVFSSAATGATTAAKAVPAVAARTVDNPVGRFGGTYVKNLAGYGPGGSLEGTKNLLYRSTPYMAPNTTQIGQTAARYINPMTGSLATGAGGFVTGSGIDAFNQHVGNAPTNYGAQLGLAGLALGSGFGMLPKSVLARVPLNPLAAFKNTISRNVLAPIERSSGLGQTAVNSGRLLTNLAFTPKLKPVFDMIPNRTVGNALTAAESALTGGTGAYLSWNALNTIPNLAHNQILSNANNAAMTVDNFINKLPPELQDKARNHLSNAYNLAEDQAEKTRKKLWQTQLQVANPYSNFWQTPGIKIPERLQRIGAYGAQAAIDATPDMKPLQALSWKWRTMPFGSWSATGFANYGVPAIHHGVNALVDTFRSPEALRRRQEQRVALQ